MSSTRRWLTLVVAAALCVLAGRPLALRAGASDEGVREANAFLVVAARRSTLDVSPQATDTRARRCGDPIDFADALALRGHGWAAIHRHDLPDCNAPRARATPHCARGPPSIERA